MARWWSVVREFLGQGFVAAERVDGYQFVPPVDSERVQAMGERCLSRPRAHRLVGQFDASARFRRDPEMKKLRSVSLFGPKNKTKHWQPLDAGGVNSTFKALQRVIMEQWLEEFADNEEKWVAGKVSASELRVLLTWWVGRLGKSSWAPSTRLTWRRPSRTLARCMPFNHSRKSPGGRVVVSTPILTGT